MPSDRATQTEILNAIVQRLRERVPEASETNCFVADQRQPVQWPSGIFCVTVVAGQGQYDEPMWTGGGFATICETLQLQVTVWLRVMLDHIPRAEQALQGDQGLFSVYKPQILRALLMQKVEGKIEHWMPVGPDGQGLLRQPLVPVNCSSPMPEASMKYMGMTLQFALTFDWLL